MSKKLSTITITGTPPQWTDEEYQRRVDMEVYAYKNTAASRERVTFPLEHQWLKAVVAKCSEGYVLCERYPVAHDLLSHTVYMIKPESMQTTDIAGIKHRVKDEYTQELQAELDRYKRALARQIVEAKIEKERLAQEAKDAKRLKEAETEADECFGELTIPDGYPEVKIEVKPADFALEME